MNVPGIPHRETIALAALTTVVLSVILHGTSATPLAERYGRRAAGLMASAQENRPVVEMPINLGWFLHPDRTEERLSAWEARVDSRGGGSHASASSAPEDSSK